MTSSNLDETIIEMKAEIQRLRADTMRLEARLGKKTEGTNISASHRVTRAGLLHAAALGVTSVGAMALLHQEAQPALADTIGDFISTNPGSDAVHATSTAGAVGVHGIDTAGASGPGIGVKGESIYGVGGLFSSSSGTGLHGDSGSVYPAIYGTNHFKGPSIFGDTTGTGTGVSGRSAASYGVEGIGMGNTGIHGQTFQADSATSPVYYYGVYGENSANGTGVLGTGSTGVIGSGAKVGVSGSGITGVSGISQNYDGNVHGAGVVGSDFGGGTSNYGVKGESSAGTAGFFTCPNGTGVHADSAGPYPAIYANNTSTGPSVFGDSTATADGVSGRSAGGNGVAGFSGNSSYPGQGYGGRFGISNNALAQLYLAPAGSGGHPTTGTHLVGELFMDPTGALYIFTSTGWQRVQTFTGPTDARITHFTARRQGARVAFQWRMADGKGIAGFELYAAGRRVNRATIRPHLAKIYKVATVWKGGGPFALHVLLRNGNVLVVHPE